MTIRFPWQGKIGIVELFGVIRGGEYAATYIELFDRMRDSRTIKAVVINIDSPGGLATASNHLHLAVSRLSARKPTIAFVSGAGASGAYLISCAATKTVAIPGAIIGSIGVISARPVLQVLLQRIGIHFDVTKSGELKDMGAFYRESTEEEKQKEQNIIDDCHRYLVASVAQGRHIEETAVQRLATGEVFLAEKARELGLIDEIGDFETAVELAGKLGKVPRRLAYLRARRGFLQRMIAASTSSFGSELLTRLVELQGEQIYYMR